ncbi:uncharacterized protein [Diabrotica undecimpunctata]|uniref:uncharacterized protein n=1 Tax=Diabrotica undecimpunctata TaxID=50387 RepID=UPI003B634276
MNYENYDKWLTEKQLLNLPSNSVIVLDNASYHNTREDKLKTSASPKADMQMWLRERNIPYTEDMLHTDLYESIKLHKPRFVKYSIDSVIRSFGHEVLRLPPYHLDINPIELVWAALKNFVRSKNVSFKLNDVTELCDEFFDKFPAEEWKKVCDKNISIEDNFLTK